MRTILAVLVLASAALAAAAGDNLILDEFAYCRSYHQFGADHVSPQALTEEGEQVLGKRGMQRLERNTKRFWADKNIDWTKTDWQLASYVWQLNNRPRKCLNYRTPAEVFHERPVALTM